MKKFRFALAVALPQAQLPTASKGRDMSLSDTILTGPGGGRTISSGDGSSAELKLAGEQSGGDWAVVEWRVRAGDEPPIHTHTREDETLYVSMARSPRSSLTSGSRSTPALTPRFRRTCRTA
jgi:hypothetical protein